MDETNYGMEIFYRVGTFGTDEPIYKEKLKSIADLLQTLPGELYPMYD